MPDPTASTASPTETALSPKRSSGLLTRLGVIGALGLVSAGLLFVGIPWGCYRYEHVVLSEATVHGVVTRMGARIEGRIKSIEVNVGERVRQGQVLLRLEDLHLQAALKQARAELQTATHELRSERMAIEQARRRFTLEIERVSGARKKAAGELDAGKSTLARFEKDYERVAVLIQSGVGSTSEMDRITGERDNAQGCVKAAIGQLEAAESSYQEAMNELEGLKVREARLDVLQSQIALAQAKVALAEADLDAAVLRAPGDGRVLERIVELGGSAKVGEPMISLWLGRAWVEAWADENDLHKFRLGSQADISLDASSNGKLSGRVEAIGLATDKHLQATPVPSTLHAIVRHNAMVPVRIALDTDSSRLQLGLSAVVGIQKESAASEAEQPNIAQSSSSLAATNLVTKASRGQF
jgi:multidrug resistance efflux pump